MPSCWSLLGGAAAGAVAMAGEETEGTQATEMENGRRTRGTTSSAITTKATAMATRTAENSERSLRGWGSCHCREHTGKVAASGVLVERTKARALGGRGRGTQSAGNKQMSKPAPAVNRAKRDGHGVENLGLPSYPPPPGGYDYSRYPSHLPRPVGNQPPIHGADPGKRCELCEEHGHVHDYCPWRSAPSIDPRDPHEVAQQAAARHAPWGHSYGCLVAQSAAPAPAASMAQGTTPVFRGIDTLGAPEAQPTVQPHYPQHQQISQDFRVMYQQPQQQLQQQQPLPHQQLNAAPAPFPSPSATYPRLGGCTRSWLKLLHGLKVHNDLLPCSSCVAAHGTRSTIPHHTTSRASEPLDAVHLDTAGPYEPSAGGSRYVACFVDSASWYGRVYGMRSKADLLPTLHKYIADVGKMKCLRFDNAGENTRRVFVPYCGANGTRREYTAPHTLQQNAVVESLIWRTLKQGHAARLDVRRPFPHLDFNQLEAQLGKDLQRCWLESAAHAVDCINRSCTTSNEGMAPPYKVFFGKGPSLKIVPFGQTGKIRVERSSKAGVQAVDCLYLNGAYNHSAGCVKVYRPDSRRFCLTKDVVWLPPQLRQFLVPPAGRGGHKPPPHH